MKQKKSIAVLAVILCMALTLSGCSRFFDRLEKGKQWEEQYDLGMDCMDDEDYEEAVEAFLEAIDIDPEKPEAYSAAAEAYMELDDLASAMEILEEGFEETDDQDLLEELTELREDAGLPPVQPEDLPGAGADTPADDGQVQMAVVDAYTHFLTSRYDVDCCYHIPRIVLDEDRGSEINEIIYREMYGILEDGVLYDGTDPSVIHMQYSWGYGENAISVLIRTSAVTNDYAEYYTYHISAKSGKILDDTYLIMTYDLSRDDFRALLEQRVRAFYAASPELLAHVSETELQRLINDSVAADNLDMARPYVGSDGSLCAVVKLYWPAGAGSYYQLLNVTGETPAAEPGCTGNHGGSGQMESDQNQDVPAPDGTQEESSGRQESPFADAQVGDIITFGTYEQDYNLQNGREAIEWLVLDKKDGRLFVVSLYGLDCQQFNTSLSSVTWSTCSLRTWLNRDFYEGAFSDEERMLIPEVLVTAERNPYYNNDPGSDTYDHVYLLSTSEAAKYFRLDVDRICYPTAYASGRGDCYVHSYLGSGWWWLRNVGEYTTDASCINCDGVIDYKDGSVSSTTGMVRPALWINCE